MRSMSNTVWIVYRRCVVPASLKLYYRSVFIRDTDQSVSLTQVRRIHAFVFVLSLRQNSVRTMKEARGVNTLGNGQARMSTAARSLLSGRNAMNWYLTIFQVSSRDCGVQLAMRGLIIRHCRPSVSDIV